MGQSSYTDGEFEALAKHRSDQAYSADANGALLAQEARRARSEESRLRAENEALRADVKTLTDTLEYVRSANRDYATRADEAEKYITAKDARIAELEVRLRDQTAATEDNYQRAANVERDRDEWKETAIGLERRAEEADRRVAELEARPIGSTNCRNCGDALPVGLCAECDLSREWPR